MTENLTAICNLCQQSFQLDITANDEHLREYHRISKDAQYFGTFFTVPEIYDDCDLQKEIEARKQALTHKQDPAPKSFPLELKK